MRKANRLSVRVANIRLYFIFIFSFLLQFYLGLGFSMTLQSQLSQTYHTMCHTKVTCHSNSHMIMWLQWNIGEHSRLITSYNVLNIY